MFPGSRDTIGLVIYSLGVTNLGNSRVTKDGRNILESTKTICKSHYVEIRSNS